MFDKVKLLFWSNEAMIVIITDSFVECFTWWSWSIGWVIRHSVIRVIVWDRDVWLEGDLWVWGSGQLRTGSVTRLHSAKTRKTGSDFWFLRGDRRGVGVTIHETVNRVLWDGCTGGTIGFLREKFSREMGFPQSRWGGGRWELGGGSGWWDGPGRQPWSPKSRVLGAFSLLVTSVARD